MRIPNDKRESNINAKSIFIGLKMKMNRRKALKNKIMPQDILTEDHDFGVENGEKQSRRNTDHLYAGK